MRFCRVPRPRRAHNNYTVPGVDEYVRHLIHLAKRLRPSVLYACVCLCVCVCFLVRLGEDKRHLTCIRPDVCGLVMILQISIVCYRAPPQEVGCEVCLRYVGMRVCVRECVRLVCSVGNWPTNCCFCWAGGVSCFVFT